MTTRATVGVLGLLVLLASAYGCSSADQQLYIRNNTEEAWLVRVNAGDGSNRQYVRFVQPHVEGLTFSWIATAETQIELLDEDCSVVGLFEATDEETVRVPGIEDIDGTIEPYRWNSQWNVPGIQVTSVCGGSETM